MGRVRPFARAALLIATACGDRPGVGQCESGLPRTPRLAEPPLIEGSIPPSPGRTRRPIIIVNTRTATQVELYEFRDGSCARRLATKLVSSASAPSLHLELEEDLAANSTTAIAVRMTERCTRTCSWQPYNYTHDAIPPEQPSFGGWYPPSPAEVTLPVLTIWTEPMAGVLVYATGVCNELIETGLANRDGRFQTSLPVAENSTTTFSAAATDAAGNVSPCTEPITFVHDDLP